MNPMALTEGEQAKPTFEPVRELTQTQKILLLVFFAMMAVGIFVRLWREGYIFSTSADSVQVRYEPPPEVRAHVKGAVRQPGVYFLRAGATRQEAVLAAGGYANGADRNAMNMAAAVRDHEELVIPGAATAAVGIPGAAYRIQKLTSGTVNINTAGIYDLMRIPGVGEVTARRIVEARGRHGRFRTIQEIMYAGISPRKYEKMKKFLSVK